MTQPQPSATAIFYRNLRWLKFVDRFGRKGSQILEYVGGLSQLVGQALKGCFTRPFYSTEVLDQMDELGVKSLSITGISKAVADNRKKARLKNPIGRKRYPTIPTPSRIAPMIAVTTERTTSYHWPMSSSAGEKTNRNGTI